MSLLYVFTFFLIQIMVRRSLRGQMGPIGGQLGVKWGRMTFWVDKNVGNKPVNGINIIPTTIITIDENIISEANWRSLKGAFRSVARARTIRTIATKNCITTWPTLGSVHQSVSSAAMQHLKFASLQFACIEPHCYAKAKDVRTSQWGAAVLSEMLHEVLQPYLCPWEK